MCCLHIKPLFYEIIPSKDVSCEFDELRVDTHLCKLRCLFLPNDSIIAPNSSSVRADSSS